MERTYIAVNFTNLISVAIMTGILIACILVFASSASFRGAQ